MKKIFVLFLVLCTALTMCISAQASPIHARVNLYSSKTLPTSNGGTSLPFRISDGKVIAQVIESEDIIQSISIKTASYANNIGGILLQVYRWDGNYSKSVSGKVLASQEFIDFADNAFLTIDLNDKNISGKILLTAKGTKEDVAIWCCDRLLPAFLDGVDLEGRSAIVTYQVRQTINKKLTSEICADAYAGVYIQNPEAISNAEIKEIEKTVNDEKVFVPAISPKAANYYVEYPVDFGPTSPKGAIIDVYNDVFDVAKIQIIADNPVDGEILCEYHVEIKEGAINTWEEISAKINTKLTGKHFIYLTGDVDAVRTAGIKFTKETPEDSKDEIRLKNFEATKEFEIIDTYSDTWTAVDLLGRKLADYEEAGAQNSDKQVGIFFWTWHANKIRQNGGRIVSNQKVINSYPGPESDIKNDFYYSRWSKGLGSWNESIYGNYNGYDEWVMRKQMELLAAVGVDGVFFDTTNSINVFTGGYMRLAKTMHEMHIDGIQTPGMSFVLPFGNLDYNYAAITRLWESMYSSGLYSDTWYYFDGKPILMGYHDKFKQKTSIPDIDKQNEDILNFFTFRPSQGSYFVGPARDDHWPWLEVYPQHAYGESDKYGCECVSVGVAMNAGPNGLDAMNGKDIFGRSYTYKDGYSKLSETSKYYGYNFREQWDRARELNPEFVFITGWNEWVVGHQEVWGQGTKGAFADQYNDEYSRDIEPTKGEMKDVYYYLLADEIRKFKGVRPTPEASAEVSIDINGGFEQWTEVGPNFIGYKGGTAPRDSYIQGTSSIRITNNTGRNDIVLSKVARDSENLYFYVKTAEAMTSYLDPSWMRLLINTDRTYKTGWEGYDFILNRISPTENKAILEKWSGKEIEDWKWEIAAEVDYKLSGNEMMIKIPRSVLGVISDVVDIEFKWNDNMQVQGDIMDVYTNGDTAPVGRFAYHYITDNSKAKKTVDEPVDPATKFEHYGRRFLIMALGENNAYAYGEKVKIDEQSDVTAPMIIKDKTMVPVRFLSESLGATVTWDDVTKTVTIAYEGKRVRLTLGSAEIRIEREKRTLQSPATEIDNRIYVPLRDIVEALGIPCHWVEPGIILVGPEDEYAKLYTNGNIDRLIEKFN